jgi:hypothetical protein
MCGVFGFNVEGIASNPNLSASVCMKIRLPLWLFPVLQRHVYALVAGIDIV